MACSQNKKDLFFNWIGNYWFVGLSLLLLSISIAMNISSSVITNESIVLGFIGVLATFVVVGNYAQVQNIEKKSDKLDKKINGLDIKINETQELENRINYVAGDLYRITALLTEERLKYISSFQYWLLAFEYYNKVEVNYISYFEHFHKITVNNLDNNSIMENDIQQLISLIPDDYSKKHELLMLLNKKSK